jgi:hypothetical protein
MEEFGVLHTIKLLNAGHLSQMMGLIKSLLPITNDFSNREHIKHYNIVLAASDIYYRENYHSDIMAYILENKKNTMIYFINYINSLSNLPDIDLNNYSNTEVIREENKIDILIRDLSSNHCIIIENKINNAGDMRRQLPRYYNTIIKNGCVVDRIVYYSLDGKKRPDKSTWTKKDLQLGLENIMVFGAAANGTDTDFVNGFLDPCKDNAEDDLEKSFYYQYTDLLEYIRRNQMDYQLMEKFYKEMLDSEHYNSALSIRDMLNEFPAFRRDRIHDYFVNDYAPFENIFKHSSNDTVFSFIRDIAPKEYIKIDIWTELKQTIMRFWIQDTEITADLIGDILRNIGEENSFTKKEKNDYIKIFKFPEEDVLLYAYIKKLFALLGKYKAQ